MVQIWENGKANPCKVPLRNGWEIHLKRQSFDPPEVKMEILDSGGITIIALDLSTDEILGLFDSIEHIARIDGNDIHGNPFNINLEYGEFMEEMEDAVTGEIVGENAIGWESVGNRKKK